MSSRLGSLIQAALRYIEARGELLQIEAAEAGSRSVGILVTIIVTITALVFGWLLALPALVWITAEKIGWHWSQVSLAMAGIHLLIFAVGFLVFRIKIKRLRIFEGSLGELQKDREWLKSSKDHPGSL